MLAAACLIVSTSASMVLLDERHRYSLPVASGSPPGSSVLLCEGKSSGTNISLIKLPAHNVCSHTVPTSSGLLLTSSLSV